MSSFLWGAVAARLSAPFRQLVAATEQLILGGRRGVVTCFLFFCEIMPNIPPQRTGTCVFLCLWGTAVLTVVLVVLLGGEIGEKGSCVNYHLTLLISGCLHSEGYLAMLGWRRLPVYLFIIKA